MFFKPPAVTSENPRLLLEIRCTFHTRVPKAIFSQVNPSRSIESSISSYLPDRPSLKIFPGIFYLSLLEYNTFMICPWV